MLDVHAIPAFQDNYLWLLHRAGHAVVVDPGDAAPVNAALQAMQLKLAAILVTHHHADHIGGVAQLADQHAARVYAPAREHYTFAHAAVKEGTQVRLPEIGLDLQVMELPGHTLGHVAYYGANMLFCGDTLFSAGCGRLFEGTPAQMLNSLQRLAALPAETVVYCTHEYTEHNLRFARSLEPDNAALERRQQDVASLRQLGLPSLPSSIGLELAINPFLRCDQPAIQNAAATLAAQAPALQAIAPQQPVDTVLATFTAIRALRNRY